MSETKTELRPLAPIVGKFRLREKCGTHTEAGEKDGQRGVWFVQPDQVVEGRSQLNKRFPEKFDVADNARKVTATFVPNAEDGGQQTLAHHAVQAELHPTKPAKEPEAPSNKEAVNTLETYKEMTVAELKQMAADDELDLGEARTKKDILDVFAKSLGLET